MEVAPINVLAWDGLALSAAWTTATQAILLVLGIAGILVVLGSSWLSRGSGRAPGPRRENATGETGRQVEELLVELDDLARSIHARLDERLARLETLLRESDRRIQELSRLNSGSDDRPALDVTLQEFDPRQNPAPEIDASRFADVYRLADQNLSPLEIARRTGRLTGEVELILSLRRSRQGLATDSPFPEALRPTG
jgi:hypothetical protein